MPTKKISLSISATLKGVPKGCAVIPRAQVKYSHRYTVQVQSGDGWADRLEHDDWNTVVGYVELTQSPETFRIVDNGDPV